MRYANVRDLLEVLGEQQVRRPEGPHVIEVRRENSWSPMVIEARQENSWAPMLLKPDRTVLGHGENHFLNKDG